MSLLLDLFHAWHEFVGDGTGSQEPDGSSLLPHPDVDQTDTEPITVAQPLSSESVMEVA